MVCRILRLLTHRKIHIMELTQLTVIAAALLTTTLCTKHAKQLQSPQLGERTSANLKHYPALQRLTYNPHFTELKMQISTFIKNVEQLRTTTR